MVGGSLEGNGVDGGGHSGGALLPGLLAVSLVVSNLEVEHLAERLALLRGSLLGREAIGNVVGDVLGGGVVETGEVKRVTGEGLLSGLGALLADDESGVLLGQLPKNAARNKRGLHDETVQCYSSRDLPNK